MYPFRHNFTRYYKFENKGRSWGNKTNTNDKQQLMEPVQSPYGSSLELGFKMRKETAI